jgi:hypothetical protein
LGAKGEEVMSDTSDTKKSILYTALEKSLGVVSTACKNAGVSRDSFYRWCKEDEEFKAKVDDLKNVSLDFAESKLLEQINSGNTTAIIFFLKTQGKNRGYIETHEVSSSDIQPIRLIMTDEDTA